MLSIVATFGGPVLVSSSSGKVATIDSMITGPLTVNGNKGYVRISGSRIGGSLSCTGNATAPVDAGTSNKVKGTASGQCSRLACGIPWTTDDDCGGLAASGP